MPTGTLMCYVVHISIDSIDSIDRGAGCRRGSGGRGLGRVGGCRRCGSGTDAVTVTGRFADAGRLAGTGGGPV